MNKTRKTSKKLAAITMAALLGMSALTGCGGVDAYRELLPAALRDGVTPVMVKECVYQAADYLG